MRDRQNSFDDCHQQHLKIKLGEILNAFVQAPEKEKMWTTSGPEFSKGASDIAMLVRAFYSLKSAGAAFTSHHARCIETMGYESYKADLNLLLKPKIRPENGALYYS